jgi:CBS domain-containing protein
MTGNPAVVTPDAPVIDAARKMREMDVGIIPVIDSLEHGHLRGVITDRDITIRVIAAGRDGRMRVDDCMTEDVCVVNENDSVSDVMRLMREERIRRVPVIDRDGRLAGIIAQADLAVDYAAHDYERESELSDTIERISEPARPRIRQGIRGRIRGRM